MPLFQSAFQPAFALNQAAVRVRFGTGLRHEVGAEVDRLGCTRAVVLATPGRRHLAEALAAHLGPRAAGVIARAEMHTPVAVTEAARREAERLGADCLVAVGGGSTIGLAKALALRTDLPQVVLPTTYAGSEATAILGQTEAGRKTTLTDPRVQPEVILYDAELARSLPEAITVASALNAVAHAAEALYARDRNPISTLLAIEGLKAFRTALPRVRAAPDDLDSRGETLYGAWLCGTVLGQVGMALHHKLCHVLGGSFDLPHAETHAVMLPHTIGFNAGAARDRLRPVAEVFGGADPGAALFAFARTVEAPRSLGALGLAEDALPAAADLAMQAAYWNPRPFDREAILGLLRRAWAGEPPAPD